MSDPVVRILVVAVVVGIAVVVAWILRRFTNPPHPTVTVGEVGDRPGIVLFTSTTCPTCKEVIALLQEMELPYREVTSDLEPQRFETWGVLAVPVTVVVDGESNVVAAMSGVPKRRAISRAAHEAGVVAG